MINPTPVHGVVELNWIGAIDAHITVSCTVSEGIETWWSSCQTSQHLVHCITKGSKYLSDALDFRVYDN